MGLPKRFVKNRKNVCIQGLGFVGSAMALAVANAQNDQDEPLYNVIGVDIDNEDGCRKVMSINNGVFPFECNDQKMLKAQKRAFSKGNLWATTNPEYFSCADVIVVDINLDIEYTNNYEPILNMETFKSAISTLGQYMKADALLIIETTVPPGTCEKVVYPIIKEEYAKRGIDETHIAIAHSYERVMPGEDYYDSIINFWRVYSGIDKISADRCQEFLESVISTVQYPLTRLENTTATEVAKVLENSYRAVNIAFIEEWARFAEAVGIDLFEVIDAIRMRPTHSNMRQPGFGVGGYCLTKDPYFASLAAKEIFDFGEMDFPFSTKAVKINNVMPLVSLKRIEEILGGNLKEKKLLVLGVSYRQDVGDTRYSPTEIFVRAALRKGAVIECQDPLVPYWKEMERQVNSDIPLFIGYDAIVFAVPHKQYQSIAFDEMKVDAGTLIFDANCVLNKEQRMSILGRKDLRFASIGRGEEVKK